MTDCSEIIQFFKSGDDDALHKFLTEKDSTGYVREPCIPASVYKQEPNCPADFPPSETIKLTPLQWMAIFMKDDLFSNEAVNYYMLDVTQDYGVDGKGKGNYRDCFLRVLFKQIKDLIILQLYWHVFSIIFGFCQWLILAVMITLYGIHDINLGSKI